MWQHDGQRLRQEWRIELVKLRLNFLAHVGMTGRVTVESFDVEFDLMEKCLDGQSDGVVVSWLGKMLLPGVPRVQKVITRLFK